MIQLADVNRVLTEAWQKMKLPIYEELIFRVNNHIEDVKEILHTNSEQEVFNFITTEINPVFEFLKKEDAELENSILAYESQIDANTNTYYDHRKNYDTSVMKINKKLASLIDKKQEDAQLMFPHYFERYKTDGIEHNMYIGNSIAGNRNF